jgi:SPP1 gp7 family putative phage head morphogenesis protein
VRRAADDLDGFESAISWFRARVPMTDDEYKRVDHAERDHAFKVAGVAQADMVNDVFTALESALVEGDFAAFKARVGKQLADEWGGADALRLDTVFDTNLQAAMNAGRYRQMMAPAVVRARPIWRLRAVRDGRTSRYCKPVDGVTLAADHPWWDRNYPPRHYRCRTYVETLPAGTATTLSPPDVPPLVGFGGRPPVVGSDWQPDLSQYPPALAATLKGRV